MCARCSKPVKKNTSLRGRQPHPQPHPHRGTMWEPTQQAPCNNADSISAAKTVRKKAQVISTPPAPRAATSKQRHCATSTRPRMNDSCGTEPTHGGSNSLKSKPCMHACPQAHSTTSMHHPSTTANSNLPPTSVNCCRHLRQTSHCPPAASQLPAASSPMHGGLSACPRASG